MIKYCPTCNRSSEEARFIGEFCEFCVADKIKATLPKVIKLRRCRVCGAIRDSDGFTDYSIEAMTDAVSHELHIPNCKIRIKELDLQMRKAVLRMVCELNDGTVGFDYEIGLRFTKEMCPSCYRKSAGYYEAILQLRGSEKNVAKFLDSFNLFLVKGNAFVSKTEEMGKGIDMYISDKKLVSGYFMLHKSLKPKVSYKLYGLKKGKKLYRHIYSLTV
ncbi:MAG: 60S ribosomal export protein NMD3 [Candidatus Marsarchaeota archaeon]|nr:60S ribosomal export protein NMD3 [Candidatus Marsarchaeota archaeon]MCL5102325.1 60S ribosomal export protein NMD3 [Candidatus Marsarchaeota archaeon]